MDNHTDIACDALLGPAQIDAGQLQSTLDALMRPGIDYGDLYFQIHKNEQWVLDDGIVRTAASSQSQGVGVRALAGEQTGFGYADELAFPALAEASDAAAAIAHGGNSARVNPLTRGDNPPPMRYQPIDPSASLEAADKLALLHHADKIARAADDRVVRVTASCASTSDTVLVAATDGTLAGDVRPLVRVNISVQVEANGLRESASAGGGARTDYGFFNDGVDRVADYARQAVDRALVRLRAEPAPAGSMPVVLGAGWPGVLLHEAVGHGLEGDFNRRGTSTYADRIGEQVASPLCTVVDDGTLDGRRGSLAVDDEGTLAGRNTLIENGVLTGYMQDKHNAGLMGVPTTGNARRESYADTVMPRMTNTYLCPGNDEPADIISSLDDGIYAVNFSGGSVDITSGNFVFSADEAYRVENGQIGAPVKGATLIGNGPGILNQVSMLGNDFALDSGVGVCGKQGQNVPVGVGQPTLKIDAITVGGTDTG
ncbi:metalloprotease TldD [Salinisphaera sp. USBA-960]|uniref:metalloprotease TldD n=1 Tax=Salinisphaera orenii TaxID=856731 RepID=UPI000DBE9FB8|nr:metalloprotease TldD [Salifodinibacter halophilus]NNC25556.1 metalloprotease TldD [Salifodinibacter halophilus]